MFIYVLASLIASTGVVTFAPDSSASTQVVYTEGDKSVVLEQFKTPDEGTSIAVSADGKWAAALRGHMRSPQTLSIYDLNAHRRVAMIETTSYLDVRFSPANTLVLSGSCGTSCGTFDVLDLAGKSLDKGLLGGAAHHDVSKGVRYAVSYPSEWSEPSFIQLTDLATGHPVAVFPPTGDGDLVAQDVSWATDETSVIVTIVSKLNPDRAPRRLRLGIDGTSAWVP